MASGSLTHFPDIGKDECWRAVLEFDSEKGFADHQLRSFDYFLAEDVPEIVEETLPLVYVTPNILGPQQQVDDEKSLVLKEASHVVHVFRFCPNAKVGYPTISYVDSDPRPITPYEARIEKQNYAAPINITICHERYAYHKKHMSTPVALDSTYETHCIGMMPIMVGSSRCWTKHPNNPKSLVQMKECELDSGGYFIVNGVEKVIISQEHMRQNIINVFTRKPSGKAVLVAEVRSARNRLRGSISPLNLKTIKQCSLLQPTEVSCQVPYIKSEVPIFLLFRALGFDDLATLKRMIGAEFYRTYDLKMIDHRLEDQPEENDKQLARLINTSWNSANACATSVEQAKLWLGKRAHQPYGDENWQTQKKNDKRKRRGGKNAKVQDSDEPEEINANRKLFKSIDEILTRDLLPHLTPPELLRSKSPLSDEVQVQDASVARRKLVFIIHMLCRLWRVQMGLDKENDRDHNAHKRFDAAGPLFAQLFTQHYYKMIKDVRKYLSRSATTGKPLSFAAGIKTKTITHGMIYACSTGNWPNQKSATPHTGVSQTVNRMNYNAFLSHMRRLNTPIDKTNSKLTGPRALHETSWGTNDPSETPEGEPCGLIKNMALCALITIAQDCTYIRRFLSSENIIPLDAVLSKVQNATYRDPMAPPLPKKQKLESSDWTFESLAQMTRVYLNGEWLGYHHQGKDLAERLKEMRRQNIIPFESAIIYSDKENQPRTLFISLEGGRSCYPVFVVTQVKNEDGKIQNRLKYTRQHVDKLRIALTSRYGWDDLLKDGVVEFLDSHEKEFAFIAPYQVDIYAEDAPAYTHCEIDPSIILGVSSGQIPNSNSNQAARNTFQCLDPSTLVDMADGTRKPIRQVRVGDLVKCFDPKTMQLENTMVTEHFVRPNRTKRVFEIRANHSSIVATEDHVFWTDKGWKQVIDISKNDQLYFVSGSRIHQQVSIDSIEEVDKNREIADINVHSDHHTFIANGFGVHNCAMGKQAIGTPTLNTAFRTDTISYQLWYPQSPLVSTRAGKYLMHNEILAAGQNVVFAIASWTGYNQDDSTMINQSAIDRGLFRSFIRRSIYVDTKKQPSNSFETFEKPNPNEVVGMKHGNYDKLDEDGFVAPGTYIQENDVIVGKTQPPPASVTKQAKNKYRGSTLETLGTNSAEKENDGQDEETKKSCKSIIHTGKPAYIENVVVGNTPQGGKYARVTTVETHIPDVSDKFSSRHGQKGTMGMAYPQHDMPFSADGISPDVIMNPHGLTSRMTIGQLKEGIFGMIAALSGKIVDGTPFYEYYGIDTRGKTESEVDEMLFSPKLKPGQTIMDATYDLLKSYGFERKGKQQLYDGRTGEPFECETFHCMVYYQALKHLGSEKKHARARGRRQTITKQPAEGRSRDGGLRFGEMERDAIIGHGASNLLVERLHYNSDPSEFYVCDSCGAIGVGEAFVDEHGAEYTLARCTYCVHSNMKLCRAPNALKTLFQELGGGNINSSIWV